MTKSHDDLLRPMLDAQIAIARLDVANSDDVARRTVDVLRSLAVELESLDADSAHVHQMIEEADALLEAQPKDLGSVMKQATDIALLPSRCQSGLLRALAHFGFDEDGTPEIWSTTVRMMLFRDFSEPVKRVLGIREKDEEERAKMADELRSAETICTQALELCSTGRHTEAAELIDDVTGVAGGFLPGEYESFVESGFKRDHAHDELDELIDRVREDVRACEALFRWCQARLPAHRAKLEAEYAEAAEAARLAQEPIPDIAEQWLDDPPAAFAAMKVWLETFGESMDTTRRSLLERGREAVG